MEVLDHSQGTLAWTPVSPPPSASNCLHSNPRFWPSWQSNGGGIIGRAEAAADHFGQPEDPRAQLATERELEFALDERETAHLAAVVAALTRIEAGTYGECTDCGTHITAARLHATPEAARCVHCQEKAEQHRRAA